MLHLNTEQLQYLHDVLRKVEVKTELWKITFNTIVEELQDSEELDRQKRREEAEQGDRPSEEDLSDSESEHD